MCLQIRVLWAASLILVSAGSARADRISITFTDTSPTGGAIVSPLWVDFHNGPVSTFSNSNAAHGGARQISQDGLSADQTALFDGNASPTAIDPSTLKPGQTLTLLGGVPNAGATAGAPSAVYDPVTETNDFNCSLGNPAFGYPGGQTAPGQGNPENGVIHAITGDPCANFLGTPAGLQSDKLNFNNAALYSSVAQLQIRDLPEPAALALLAGVIGMSGLLRARHW